MEEVAAYIKAEGLTGKVSPSRFHEYYAKQKFVYKGAPIDWKKKVHEWAARERGNTPLNAADYKLFNPTTVAKAGVNVSVDEVRRRVALI